MRNSTSLIGLNFNKGVALRSQSNVEIGTTVEPELFFAAHRTEVEHSTGIELIAASYIAI
jgi:hypothetical protein